MSSCAVRLLVLVLVVCYLLSVGRCGSENKKSVHVAKGRRVHGTASHSRGKDRKKVIRHRGKHRKVVLTTSSSSSSVSSSSSPPTTSSGSSSSSSGSSSSGSSSSSSPTTSSPSSSSTQHPAPTCTGHDQIPCPGNPEKCILESWLCDFVMDCPDGTDEMGCDLDRKGSPNSWYQDPDVFPPIPADCGANPGDMICGLSTCIPRDRICDHIIDCIDGQDETTKACFNKNLRVLGEEAAQFVVKTGFALVKTQHFLTDYFSRAYCRIFKHDEC